MDTLRAQNFAKPTPIQAQVIFFPVKHCNHYLYIYICLYIYQYVYQLIFITTSYDYYEKGVADGVVR